MGWPRHTASVALLLGVACIRPQGPGFQEDWAFLFYVPYDNDLGTFATEVREAIREGTAGGIPAYLLEDTPEDTGVVLWTCAGGACTSERLPGVEDSADIATFRRLLEHSAERAEARRYGVVVLDHGGRQGELARHPDWGGAQVAEAIASGDDSGMYATYTCVKSAALEPLTQALAGLPVGASLDAVAMGLYGYGGEGYVDLGVLLDALGSDRRPLDQALCGHFRNPAAPEVITTGFRDPKELAGLSMALSQDPALSIHAVPGWSAWAAGAVLERP